MPIYLDNAATTKPCKACIDAINNTLTEDFGNPSSLHSIGVKSKINLIHAKERIAKSLCVNKDEIYFTSGGTEANNLAVFGAVYANKRKGNRIVTTAIEHESVLSAAKQLESEGFEVIYLEPDKTGNITEEQIFNAVNDKTILVSIMLVNNEVGTYLPVSVIKKAVKRANAPALIHTDCVQGYGKISIRADKLGTDLLTITAHKIHGPKGIGALYIKKGTHILPRTFGGEQEKRIRPGTESTPLIAGFSAAAESLPNLAQQEKTVAEIRNYAVNELENINGIIINNPANTSPYILNVYLPTFMRSQTIIQELSSNHDIFVSSGSACAKGKRSHVLTAMKLKDEIIDKSIRISFSRETTMEDAHQFVKTVKELIKGHKSN